MSDKEKLYTQIKRCAIDLLSDYYQGKRISFSEDEKTHKRKLLSEKEASMQAEKVVEAHIVPDKLDDAKDIYRRLLISGQNRNMMPNVIKFMEREPKFRTILSEFNYIDVAKMNSDAVLSMFKKTFELDENKIKPKANHPSLWQQYAEFVVSAAKFMKESSPDYKIDTFKNNIKNKKGNLSEPEFVANKIDRIGYALACDFLKEIGYDMAKPDLHIIAFLEHKYGKKFTEQEAIEKIKELSESVADNIKNKVYALDKLIWLCCTGNFYKENIKIKPKTLRDEFLSTIK